MSREHVVSVRLSDAEHERLEALATQRGVPAPDLMRHLIRTAEEPQPMVSWHAQPISGTCTAPLNVIWNAAA